MRFLQKVINYLFDFIVIFVLTNFYGLMHLENQDVFVHSFSNKENFIQFMNVSSARIKVFLVILLILFLVINVIPLIKNLFLPSKKLKNTANGTAFLKLFVAVTAASIILFIIIYIYSLYHYQNNFFDLRLFFLNYIVWGFCVQFIVFWNGMIRVYISSTQLGFKTRFIAGLCGLIPILNLIMLGRMIFILDDELIIEENKIHFNNERKDLQICKTKYPLLMVHGIFFRDSRHFNYWGRIPSELIFNGAQVFYGNHQSASSVIDSAKELKERIKQILQETGAEKVNIIAHSKGGLDCRYLISKLNMENQVASLTTINTPHRGCEFADYLLKKIPPKYKTFITNLYNRILKKLGDENPDFISGVTDLTFDSCKKFNEEVIDSKKVYYQSYGSRINSGKGGIFPLNLTYRFIKQFDGPNDGLVGEKSFSWGSKYEFLTNSGKRGISHGDMIDLTRENYEGFDVREFFVKLVADLKTRGF